MPLPLMRIMNRGRATVTVLVTVGGAAFNCGYGNIGSVRFKCGFGYMSVMGSIDRAVDPGGASTRMAPARITAAARWTRRTRCCLAPGRSRASRNTVPRSACRVYDIMNTRNHRSISTLRPRGNQGAVRCGRWERGGWLHCAAGQLRHRILRRRPTQAA